MIERYSDHAANERTFLAWVRTAITIMAFGFLVQKFDLFLRIANRSFDARSTSAASQIVGNIAGLLVIVLGGVVMAFAAIRFRKTTRDIDSKEVQPGPGEGLDITLVSCSSCWAPSYSSIWSTRESVRSELASRDRAGPKHLAPQVAMTA
jgi:putative membrane protein